MPGGASGISASNSSGPAVVMPTGRTRPALSRMEARTPASTAAGDAENSETPVRLKVSTLNMLPGESVARLRLAELFDGVDRVLDLHFGGRNPYHESIDRNLAYLSRLIDGGRLAEGLRRHPAALIPGQ